MQALFLDYKQHRNPPGWRDIALVVAGLVTASYAGIHYSNLARAIDALETQQAALANTDTRRVDSRVAALGAQQLRAEVKQANVVLAQLALPWEILFKDLESSPSAQVALLSIDPDAEKHTVKIVGEAKDLATMLGYVKSLQRKKSLTQVYLQNHRIEHEYGENPVRFTLTALWVIKS